MSNSVMEQAQTVRSMRPIVPAKAFEISKRFYMDLGFQPRPLTDNLVEMRLGVFAFILQDYYVQQWADNFVMHMSVSDLELWWKHIASLDLSSRYGVKSPRAPQLEEWGLIASVIDPSAAGRAYAAYGGVYIVASLLWLWIAEGIRPDRWDIVGAMICLVGAAVIVFGPRAIA